MTQGHKILTAFSPLDLVTIAYVLISAVYLSFSTAAPQHLLPHFTIRLFLLALIISVVLLNQRLGKNRLLSFVRNFYPLLFLGFFYMETSFINNIIFKTRLDPYFSGLEKGLWGCQPSLVFSQVMNQEWFNEVMNMCYFSYYILITWICFALYFKKPAQSQKGIFIIVFSFYLYYIIFAILPVVGPQYYFQNATAAAMPTHLFGGLMHRILEHCEKPTGAFPSSHVGIAIVIAYLSYLYLKKSFFIVLPFVLGICFATVYIKAHYLIDVFAGIVTAPLFILLSQKIYYRILSMKKRIKNQNDALTFV